MYFIRQLGIWQNVGGRARAGWEVPSQILPIWVKSGKSDFLGTGESHHISIV
jgi:hypothetical protein